VEPEGEAVDKVSQEAAALEVQEALGERVEVS
jgi:hypothetical protein